MSAPPDLLRRIVERRRARYGPFDADSELPAPAALDSAAASNRFVAALAARRGAAVIAEIKLGSPRLGDLTRRVDVERQVDAYVAGGAAALSVVVEPDFFHGSPELLRRARARSGLPAIAKDFVVHPRQLDEAAAAGADAVLLIAALYENEALRRWAGAARARGLAPLVETHDRADLARLHGAAWELVGVNSRDLRSFDVDLALAVALRPALPEGALAVAESGIATGADVARLRAAGFDAFLVGESLLLAEDPEAKLRELVG